MNIKINEGPFGNSISISDTGRAAKPGDLIPIDLVVSAWPTGIRVLHPVGFRREPEFDLHISPEGRHAWFVDPSNSLDHQGSHLTSSSEADWARHAWPLPSEDTIEDHADLDTGTQGYVVTAVWAA